MWPNCGRPKAGFTRREFLLRAVVAASAAPVILLAADAPPSCGLLDSFKWGDRQIPVSDSRLPANRAIDDAVLAAMREHGVVGCSVSVVRGDALIYAKGFGFAELPQTPFLPTAATRCGSLAKPVTALAALQLSDQGKLDLDAEVVPILREVGIVPGPVRGHKVDERIAAIKVRHLMDHTSGLPNETTYTAWRPGVNVAARQRLEHVATGADVAADGLGTLRLPRGCLRASA
jgi:CubicO group peptidase (beta-lactamase class C family)